MKRDSSHYEVSCGTCQRNTASTKGPPRLLQPLSRYLVAGGNPRPDPTAADCGTQIQDSGQHGHIKPGNMRTVVQLEKRTCVLVQGFPINAADVRAN